MSESRSSRRSRSAGQTRLGPAPHTSLVRTGIALLLVLLGIAWLVVYVTVADPTTDGTKLTWMGDLTRWNYVIGQNITVPLLTDLSQYNLVVGIGFMAVGFVYATHWE